MLINGFSDKFSRDYVGCFPFHPSLMAPEYQTHRSKNVSSFFFHGLRRSKVESVKAVSVSNVEGTCYESQVHRCGHAFVVPDTLTATVCISHHFPCFVLVVPDTSLPACISRHFLRSSPLYHIDSLKARSKVGGAVLDHITLSVACDTREFLVNSTYIRARNLSSWRGRTPSC